MFIDGLEDTPTETVASGCGFAGFPGGSKSFGGKNCRLMAFFGMLLDFFRILVRHYNLFSLPASD
jgi:hypothetical protein